MAVDRSTVLFDLDDTLCRHRRGTDELLAEAFARAGHECFCSDADLRAVVGEIPTAETDVDFYASCLRAAADRVGAVVDDVREIARIYDSIVSEAVVELTPGAKTALSVASEAHHVGLVTNGNPETQRRKLEALGIADVFDVCVFGEPSVGYKPDPEPFEHALRALSATPREAIHVGDSLYADVGGATALGMDVAWVPHGDEDASRTTDGSVEPTHTLASLAELGSIL